MLIKVKKLNEQQSRHLINLLKHNPERQEIEAFLETIPSDDSSQVEETSPISISRKIQNSQLSAALSLMDSSTLKSTHGMH